MSWLRGSADRFASITCTPPSGQIRPRPRSIPDSGGPSFQPIRRSAHGNAKVDKHMISQMAISLTRISERLVISSERDLLVRLAAARRSLHFGRDDGGARRSLDLARDDGRGSPGSAFL